MANNNLHDIHVLSIKMNQTITNTRQRISDWLKDYDAYEAESKGSSSAGSMNANDKPSTAANTTTASSKPPGSRPPRLGLGHDFISHSTYMQNNGGKEDVNMSEKTLKRLEKRLHYSKLAKMQGSDGSRKLSSPFDTSPSTTGGNKKGPFKSGSRSNSKGDTSSDEEMDSKLKQINTTHSPSKVTKPATAKVNKNDILSIYLSRKGRGDKK